MKDFENLPLDRSELFGGGLSKLLMIIAHPLGWQVCFVHSICRASSRLPYSQAG